MYVYGMSVISYNKHQLLTNYTKVHKFFLAFERGHHISFYLPKSFRSPVFFKLKNTIYIPTKRIASYKLTATKMQ